MKPRVPTRVAVRASADRDQGVSFHKDDAINVGKHVKAKSAMLVYLDPPFNVGTFFGARVGKGDRQEALKSAGYSDVWPSLNAYLDWLRPRLAAAWQTVHPRGSLWLHLDHRASRDTFAELVAICGRDCFRGEIIWIPGNGSKARKGMTQTHQSLQVFSRSPDFTWNRQDPTLREPYAATSLAMHFTNKERDGRLYRERIVAGKKYRYYADEGRALGSVWADCPSMVANTPLRKETTGYPTQKPEKLLERIVRFATNEADLVVDPFMGSGTTLAVASRLGRRAVGLDLGDYAHEIVRTRLNAR
jgi:site-specific DNA-methyltransferase (adenine-specific)